MNLNDLNDEEIEEIESIIIDILAGNKYKYKCVNKRCVRDPNGVTLVECIINCMTKPPIPTPTPTPTPKPTPTTPPTEEKCAVSGDPPSRIIFGSRCLVENIWGVTNKENFAYDQNCIFKSGDKFGWRWNRKAPSGSAPIYPSLNTGRSAWGISNNPCSDTIPSVLPKKLSDISSVKLDVTHEYLDMPHTPPGGIENSYNFTYDIWITTTPNPNQDANQRREIMVWLNNNYAWPIGSNTGKTFTDPSTNITYNVWYYKDPKSDFINTTFIIGDPNNNNPAQSGRNNFKVDFKTILDWLINQGYISNNMYLCQIDLGNEIWQNTGKIQIDELRITLNGTDI